VVGVQDNGNAVCGGDAADVVGGSDGAVDGGELVLVGDTLGGVVNSPFVSPHSIASE
jgi:hypothetical protein